MFDNSYTKTLDDISQILAGHEKTAGVNEVDTGASAQPGDSREHQGPGSIIPEEKKKDEAVAGESMYPTDNVDGDKSTEALNNPQKTHPVVQDTQIKAAGTSMIGRIHNALYKSSMDESGEPSAANMESDMEKETDVPNDSPMLEDIGLSAEDIAEVSDEDVALDEEEISELADKSASFKQKYMFQKKASFAFCRKILSTDADFMKAASYALQPDIKKAMDFNTGRVLQQLEKAGALVDPKTIGQEIEKYAQDVTEQTLEKLASDNKITINTPELEKQASIEKRAAAAYMVKEAAFNEAEKVIETMSRASNSRAINDVLSKVSLNPS